MIAGAGIARFIPTPRKPLPHAIITGNSEPKAYLPNLWHCLQQSGFLRIPIGFPPCTPSPTQAKHPQRIGGRVVEGARLESV